MTFKLKLTCLVSIFMTLPLIILYGKGANFMVHVTGNVQKNKAENVLTRTRYITINDKEKLEASKREFRLGFTPVLLLAYLRSGSSFTADLVQQASNTFYVFEPLMNILQRISIKTNTSCKNTDFFSEECRESKTNDFLMGQISQLFNCNYTKPFLQPDPHQGGSRNQIFLSKCLRIHTRRPLVCYRQLKQTCLKSTVRLVKTIRISVSLAKSLLEQIPNLKILHLVRDPRAMIASRKYGDFMTKENNYLLSPEDICPRYERDIAAAKEIKKMWPYSLLTIFYEDLALKPLSVANDIYNFMGLKLPNKMYNWIKEHTSSRMDDDYYGTKRANSSNNISKWKKTLGEAAIQETDKVCASFYKSVNYFYRPYGKKM